MSAVKKSRNVFSAMEIAVLKELNCCKTVYKTPIRDVMQIAVKAGVSDSEEVLRALYTLEGRCLVRPSPEGDFTSNFWEITDIGIKACAVLS